MKKIWSGILLGGAFSSFFVAQNLLAYDQHNTHPALTSEAVNFYNLNFPKNRINEKEKQLLIKGAVEEDFLPRPVNHFYDPIYQRGWAGYRSSKLWARSSAQQQETRSLLALNPWSMQKSSDDWPADFSYERTLLDYAKGNRDRAFEAFGHVMHLLEDANVPEHTRNDTHADIGHNTGSPYELTMAKWNQNNFSVAKKLRQSGQKPILLDDLDQYFDSIAGYSNGYFFSQDTISNKKYEKPVIKETIEYKDGTTYGMGTDKNGESFLLAKFKVRISRNFVEIKGATLIDDKHNNQILDGYWSRLSKDFVLHGAGALKMFLEQAEEFKKEYEKQLALKKESKRSVANIFGFGKQKNGIAMVQEFLENSKAEPFEDQGSALDTEGTEVRPSLGSKVEPPVVEIKSVIEAQPQREAVLPATVPDQTVQPSSLPAVSLASASVSLASAAVFNTLGGGGGGNQTAAPASFPKEDTATPVPTPSPTPESVSGRVVVNEIAWMGTATSSNDEWIELYNTSSQSADLTGWTLKAKDGTPSVSLLPISIGPFSFYLLERTANSTVLNIAADQIYTGALGNTGEILELRDAGSNLQDIVSKSASGGWYAGNNPTKATMERINPLASGSNQNNWATNDGLTKNGLDAEGDPISGTPRSKNSVFSGQKPSKISNLTVSSSSGNKITFSWNAPSDKDTLSNNLQYDLRYATKSFDLAIDWDSAKQVSGLPTVDNFGKIATYSLTIDDFNKTYYFVIKTKDVDNNFSDLSNQVDYLLPSAISGSGWSMFGFDSKHTLKTGFLGPAAASTTTKWGIQLLSSPPINFGQSVIAPNGTVYLGASNGTMSQLYAIAPSGLEKWQYVATSGATIGTPVALSDNSVLFGYVSNGTEFVKVSDTGIAKYTNLIGTINAVTVDKNGTSYFTSSADKLVAVSRNGTKKWVTYKDGITGLTPTVLDNDEIYLTARVSGVPTFYAFDINNGNFLWSKTMSTNSPTCCGVSDISYDLSSDFLYAGADQYILKIDRNGLNLEQFAADRQVGWGYITTMISQDTSNLIFGLDFSINNPASKSAVYAVNKSTKELTWKYLVDAKINKQIALDSGGNSYFSTQNGWIYSLNQTGGLNWKIDLSGTTSAYPVIVSGTLYITLDGARLVKIGE